MSIFRINMTDSADRKDSLKRTGRLQVYTGNGKGKTTAMMGLSVRAACSGMKVYIGQFMKGQDYSELCLPERFPELITMEQYGAPDFIAKGAKPSETDLKMAAAGLSSLRQALVSGSYDLVAADEICVCVYMGLLEENEVVQLAELRPKHVELVFTGRYATHGIIRIADLVTEMMEVKHYYNTEKLMARKGIEN